MDLRQLFSKYRVDWRDRGANCNKEHVNICCPLCGSADHGFHCGVSEIGEGFYCLRNPKHNGGYFKLFASLRIPTSEIKKLNFTVKLKDYNATPVVRNYSAFDTFHPGYESDEVCSYLFNRGFSDPVAVCKKFDVRFAAYGKWVGRVIIPLTKGWTGRAMRPNMQLRYLSETDETGAWEYEHPGANSLVLVEGPLDGMRLASVSDLFSVRANLGKRITPTFALHVLNRMYKTVYYAPDGDVGYLEQWETLNLIRSYCSQQLVQKISFPQGKKDACEMDEIEARRWILTATQQTTQLFA